jgi:hypothetical protein
MRLITVLIICLLMTGITTMAYAAPETNQPEASMPGVQDEHQADNDMNPDPVVHTSTYWWILILPVVLVLAVLGTVVLVVLNALKKNKMNWRD